MNIWPSQKNGLCLGQLEAGPETFCIDCPTLYRCWSIETFFGYILIFWIDISKFVYTLLWIPHPLLQDLWGLSNEILCIIVTQDEALQKVKVWGLQKVGVDSLFLALIVGSNPLLCSLTVLQPFEPEGCTVSYLKLLTNFEWNSI